MKKATSPSSEIHTLGFYCHDSSSLRTKIALLTFYKVQYPFWVEKVILILEYLQLMSQAILLIYESSEHHNIYIFEIVAYIMKLANPSYLLSYHDRMTSNILGMMFCCTLLKLLLFVSVIDHSIRNKEMNSWLLRLWRWIYKLQTRVLCFLFTSFWIKTIIETHDSGFKLLGMGKHVIIFVASIMIAIEYLFSWLLETQLCYFLPTKNFLAAKNYQLQMATLIQKFAIQMIILKFRSGLKSSSWIIPIVGLIGDVRRFSEFFLKLPLYRPQALELQGSLMSGVIALNLAIFANNILQSTNYYGNASIKFVVITWILLALLTTKTSSEILKFKLFALLCTKINRKKSAVELFLHKITLTKELHQSETFPTSETSKYAFGSLVATYHKTNLEEIFGLDGIKEEPRKKIFLLYCQKLSKKYPKNSLVKLHLAHRSFKNMEPYAKVIKMAAEIQRNRWSKNNLGASLLLHDVEKAILNNVKEQQQKDEKYLDFSTYIRSMLLVEGLKGKMLKQTDLNLKICNNMLENSCDLEEIHSCAQRISNIKIFVKKRIEKLSINLSENFISPYLLFAEYHLVANHSKDSFEKYHEIYMQKFFKAQNVFQEPSLCEENLYQDSNALVLISTQKNEYGKMLYCSNSLLDICGGQTLRLYEGSNITVLFPRILKDYYDDLFRQNEEGSMNKIHRGYISNKARHLVEVEFCFKYHPYLTQGLCLSLIIRPVPVTENVEFLILAENGEIEGASKYLSKLLRLNKVSSAAIVSIKDISDELDLMNTAVNKILKQKNSQDDEDKYDSPRRESVSRFMRAKSILHSAGFKSQTFEMSYQKAKEIHETFTLEGKEVEIYGYSNISQGEEGEYARLQYQFHSRVQVLEYGNLKMKLVILNKLNPKDRKEEVKIEAKVLKYEDPIVTDYGDEIPLETFPMTTERRSLMGAGETLVTEFQESPRMTSRRFLASRRENRTPGMSLFDSNVEMSESTEIGHFALSYIKRKNPRYTDTQSSMERRSFEKAENKIFRQAIVSKSYPKSFTSLCLIFYLVILLTFTGQLIMKSVSDSTMEGLETSKTLLRDSEERTYKGVLLQANARGVMLLIGNLLQAGGVFLPLTPGAPNMRLRMTDMKIASDQMIKYLYILDRETKEKILALRVRIDGTYLDSDDKTYQFVNIFQVTDEALMAVRAIASLAQPGGLAGYHVANYLAKNLCDDFLYQSTQVTNILTENVEKQKEFLQEVTNLFLTLNPLLLTGMGVLLCGIIWNQYRIEKENMRIFIKIPPEGVKKIHHRLSQFHDSLMNEENVEKKWLSRTHQDLQLLYKREATSAYSKKAETQQIQYDAFQKRYFKYIARVIVCISVLVMITIWDLIKTRHAIQVIYNQQSQLQYANFISNRAMVTHITYVELFQRNDTQAIEGEDAFEGLVDNAKLLGEILSEVPQRFLEVDGTYNPQVGNIIFVNDPECKVFNVSFVNYCLGLTAKGQPMNMIVAIASLQNIIETKIQDFLKVDRSTMAQLNAAMSWTESSLSTSVVIAEEAHTIAAIMDKSITEKMAQMKKLKTTIIVVFSMSLLVVSVLVWFYILQVIRNVYNDFRNVLQTLPPNLVLSSYLLKRFLQNTTTEHLFKKV